MYPTGEFSFGMDTANYSLEKRRSNEYERIHALQYHDLTEEDGTAWMRLPLDVAEWFYPEAVEGQQKRLDMGLSTLHNCRKIPERYGSKGLTSYGAKMVKSAAYLLEKEYGKERLTFGTYTLPPMSEAFRQWFHERWGDFVKRIFEHIKRELERKNADCTDYVAVTEIQERRLASFGAVYLHLHFVIVGRSKEGAYYLTTRKSDKILDMVFRNMVERYKRETGNEDEEIRTTLIASGNLQRVKKSVVSYLGKYMSKGRKKDARVPSAERAKYYPRQWWTISSNLRKLVRSRIQVLTHELCDAIAHDESMQAIWVEWIVPITKEFDGQVYTLGYVGKLAQGWECLLERVEAELPKNTVSESEAALDSSARIRIKRRRVPLDLSAVASSRLRSDSVKADRVKSERELSVYEKYIQESFF